MGLKNDDKGRAYSKSMEEIEPIKITNFLNWAEKTVRHEKRVYKRKSRPMSIHRLFRMLIPNLERPIFIVGSARSGTTFLGSCLAELHELSYHFEPVITKAAVRYVYEGLWKESRAGLFYRTVYAWLMRLHFDADLRFAEKQPRAGLIIPFLFKTFPDAQFVHLIRDGRDAALSWSKQPWLQDAQSGSKGYEPGGYRYGPYARLWVEKERTREFETTTDIHRCIWGWRRLTESVIEFSMRLPGRQYHELRYENLVTNPVDEAERLMDFLGIFAPESRDVFKREVMKARTDSVGRWKREVSNKDLKQIELEAGKLLHRLGYVK